MVLAMLVDWCLQSDVTLNSRLQACMAKVAANGNFYGPFINGTGPAPGPAPGCEVALKKDGCLTGKLLTCLACAEIHRDDLAHAGCVKGDYKALCSA